MSTREPAYEGPDVFFIAKLIVPQDTATDVVNLLGNEAHVKIERQQFNHEHQNWAITCYSTSRSLVADLNDWHQAGNIEEFRII